MRRSLTASVIALLLAGALAGCDDDDGDRDRSGDEPRACATPQAGQRIGVAPPVVGPGARITVSGTGWVPDADVTLLLGPPQAEADPIAETRTDEDGAFRTELVVSPFLRPGRWVLLACRCECRVQARATFAVSGS